MSKKQTILVIAILLITTLSCNALATPAPIVSPSTASPLPTPTTEIQQPPSAPTPEKQPPLTEAEVPRVTPQDAKAAFESGEAIIVDVRNKQVYDVSHIKGAILIPLADIENNPAGLSLDKKQWIITYCTWQNEHTSARAAFDLLHNGYSRVTPILGGLQAWIDAGYPVEP